MTPAENPSSRNVRAKNPRPWVPVASGDGFVLYERPGISFGGWLNIKVTRANEGAGKRNWHFGWSTTEQRLSRSSDALDLAEHHPELRAWVVDTLKQVPDQQSNTREESSL